jgi:hypothetical protein
MVESTEDISSLVISDATGRIVYQAGSQPSKAVIDVARLCPGLYMVRVNGSTVSKFVKE